jgi:hypothetical protein
MVQTTVEAVKIIFSEFLSSPVTLQNIDSLTFADIDSQLSREDQLLISALDWFTFEDAQLKHLFEYCNILLRRFLGEHFLM